MRIAICDDEKEQRSIIKTLLNQSRHFAPNMEICEFASGEELIHSISREKEWYDIIFLDIAMGGMNGIETARTIRKYRSEAIIIFITGIVDYVLQAFEVKAFRYLIKPVSEIKFDKEFKNAVNEGNMANEKNYLIHSNQRIIRLKLSELIYIESNLRKITVYATNDTYTFYGKFADQENRLSKHGFMTINKGILVNLAHVKFVDKNNIYLKNGKELPLSRIRRKEIYDRFTHFMLENTI